MAQPKSSFPTSQFIAEATLEASYPIASAADTTSIYFQENGAEMDVDYTPDNTDLNATMVMDSNSLQGYADFMENNQGYKVYKVENNNLTNGTTPMKLGIELTPADLRNNNVFNNNRKRRIQIATPSTELPPNETRMGSLKTPKSSRAPRMRRDSPAASPGQKLARLRTKGKNGRVEVQTVTLSPSPSPSSPPPNTPTIIPYQPPNTPTCIPYPPPNTPAFAVADKQTNPSSSSTLFQFDGNRNLQLTKVRLKELFSTAEFVDQLLDTKTVDWQCVLDETKRKYFIEFSKTN